jgi:hypothetical protein
MADEVIEVNNANEEVGASPIEYTLPYKVIQPFKKGLPPIYFDAQLTPPKALYTFYDLTPDAQRRFITNNMRKGTFKFLLKPNDTKVIESLIRAHQKYPCDWAALSLYSILHKDISIDQLKRGSEPTVIQKDHVGGLSADFLRRSSTRQVKKKLLKTYIDRYKKKPTQALAFLLYSYFTSAPINTITQPMDQMMEYVTHRIEHLNLNDPAIVEDLEKDVSLLVS